MPSVETGELTTYDAIYDWIRYMKCDIFWAIGGQTTGWTKGINSDEPWAKDMIKNIENLASSKKKEMLNLALML